MLTNKKFCILETSKRVSIYNLTKNDEVCSNFIRTLSRLKINGNLSHPTSFYGTKLLTTESYDYLTSIICRDPGEELNNGLLAIKDFGDSIDIYGGKLDSNFWVQEEIIENCPRIESIVCFSAKPRPVKKFKMNFNGVIVPLIPSTRYLVSSRLEQIEKNFWAYNTQYGPVIGFNKELDPEFLWGYINKYWIL